MRNFVIPTNIVRIANPNPYIIARELGLNGIRKLAIPPQVDKKPSGQDSPYPASADIARYQAQYKSSFFGTPIFAPLVFKAGSYTDRGVSREYPEIIFETVVYDLAMTKNVIKTAVQGRAGTIKEYISKGDYDINIRGLMASRNPQLYPEAEVAALISVLDSNQEIEVESFVLNQMISVYNVVVENYSFDAVAGFQNIQRFTIKCVSDEPIELRIREEN